DGVHGRPPTERWRRLAREKAAQVDEFIAHAKSVRKVLLETLDHQCPMLVERGAALAGSRKGLRPGRPRKPRSSISRRSGHRFGAGNTTNAWSLKRILVGSLQRPIQSDRDAL